MLSNILCKKAYEAYIEGEFQKALKHIESCLSRARRATLLNKDKNSEEFLKFIETKLFEGRIYIATGNYDEAKSVFSDVNRKVIGSNISNNIRGKIQYFLSDIAKKQRNLEEAVSHLNDAKNFFIKAEMFQEAIDICFELEQFPSYANEEEKLSDLYKEILNYNKYIDDKQQQKINSAKTRFQIGKLLKSTDWKKAQSTFIKAQKDLKDLNKPKLEAKTLLELAQLRSYQDFSRAVEIARKALKVSFTPDIRYIANIRLATYMIWQNALGRNDLDIFDLTAEIKDLHEETMNTLTNADDLLEIGKATFINSEDSKLLNEGLEILELSREIYDAHNNKEGKVMTHLTQGLLSHRLENDNSKLKLIKVLAKNVEEIKDATFRSPQFKLVHVLSNNEISQEEMYELIEESFDNRPQIMFAEFLHLIGMYYYCNEDIGEAKFFLARAVDAYKQVSDSSIETDQIISKIFEDVELLKN